MYVIGIGRNLAGGKGHVKSVLVWGELSGGGEQKVSHSYHHGKKGSRRDERKKKRCSSHYEGSTSAEK